jgi:hypothetical protein
VMSSSTSESKAKPARIDACVVMFEYRST